MVRNICICCKKEFPNVFDDVAIQPDNALEFTTRGHYGSCVYDNLDNANYLSIIICDECVIELAEKGLVTEVTPAEKMQVTIEKEKTRPFKFRFYHETEEDE